MCLREIKEEGKEKEIMNAEMRRAVRHSEEQLKSGSAFVGLVYILHLFMSENTERQLPKKPCHEVMPLVFFFLSFFFPAAS